MVAARGLPGWPLELVMLETLWGLALIFLMLSSTVDILAGVAMQSGVGVARVFNWPVLARSPRDLWSKRWNLYVHALAYRNVFLPLRGVHHPTRATIAIFGLSGLCHEYMLWVAHGGPGPYPGWVFAFFLCQGLGVLVDSGWQRFVRRRYRKGGRWRKFVLPAPLAVALHLCWLVMTGPLFLIPLDTVLGFSSWTLF